MIRLEIVFNAAVEEELKERLIAADATHFSELPEVYGQGRQEPRRGDSIWPEVNKIIIVYCDETHAERVINAVLIIKKNHPLDGVKVFKLSADIEEF